MPNTNSRMYNQGNNASNPSSVGMQMNEFHYQRVPLIEAAKKQYFSQLASVTDMPKHMGKAIKKYHYLPLLDDANINSQGIDKEGNVTLNEVTIEAKAPNANEEAGAGRSLFFVAEGSSEADALAKAKVKVVDWAERSIAAGGLGLTPAGADDNAKYATLSTTGGSSAYDMGFRFVVNDAVEASGNLYGSSKSVGTIVGKLPALGEAGGRVNRVGFTRIHLTGSIEKFGFFDEYSQESMDFDSDKDLKMHVNREMIMGANEITEDALQIDLLNAAGVVRYCGLALKTSELTGEGADKSEVSYEDFQKLAITLTNNRAEKDTTIITGSRMIDTKVINGAFYMYVGTEMLPTLYNLKDNHGERAYIEAKHYANAGTLARGEEGSIGQFRIIVVPEMMHWEGAGAEVTDNTDGFRETNGAYDVFPLLVVGGDSFTTIGFQTSGDMVKFQIFHKPPGEEVADRNNPYGEIGFMSIKWFYGTMILRPERIAVIKSVARY